MKKKLLCYCSLGFIFATQYFIPVYALELEYIDDLYNKHRFTDIHNYLKTLNFDALSPQDKQEYLLTEAKLNIESYNIEQAKKNLQQIYLLNAANKDNKIIVKANILQAAIYMFDKDINNCLELLNQTTILAENDNLTEDLGDIYTFYGYLQTLAGKDSEALPLYDIAEKYYKETNNTKKLIDLKINRCNALNNMAKYSDSKTLIAEIQDLNATIKNPKSEAKLYSLLTSTYVSESNTEKSLESINKAIELSSSINDDVLLADSYNWKGIILTGLEKFDEAEKLFINSKNLFLKHFDENHPQVAFSKSNLSSIYYKKGLYKEALDLAIQANSSFIKSYGENHPVTANSYNQLAEFYNKLGNDDKALSLYNNAINIMQNIYGKEHLFIAFIYNNIASIYYKQQKYHEAIEWYNKTLFIINKYYKDDNFYYSKVYNNLSLCYYNISKSEKALEYLLKSIELIKKNLGENSISLAIAYNNLATLYQNLHQYELSIDYYLKSEYIYEILDENNNPSYATLCCQLAYIYNMLEDYDKALSYYFKALNILKNHFPETHPEIILTYNYIGGSYENKHDYVKATAYYKKALSLSKNLDNSQVLGVLYSNLGYINQKQKNYSRALAYYKESLNNFNNQIFDSSIKKDKFNFSNKNTMIYDNFIESAINIDRLDEALYFSDISRYQDLTNTLAYKKNLLNSKISNEQKDKLSELEQQYNEANNACLTSSIYDDSLSKTYPYCETEISSRNELQKYINDLNKQYQISQNGSISPNNHYDEIIKVIKQKNLENTAFIEYFVGYNNLTIFIVYNNKISIIQEKISSYDLEDLINQYNKPFRLAPVANSKSSLLSILKQYNAETSYKLFKVLLEKPIENLKTNESFSDKTNIIIIPHESLYYLSFESLLTEQTKINKNNTNIALGEFKDLPYLIRKYKISYLPNLNLIKLIDNQESPKDNEFLIIGNPDLEQTKLNNSGIKNLASLPYSELEAKNIKDLLADKAKLIINKDAQEEEVTKLLDKYKNVHLACHGILNKNEPLYSGIVLSSHNQSNSEAINNNNDGILYTYELLNKKLNTNLVVLSACDSGLGQINSGEGVLGIARAFLMSGTPSIIISLWKINDESTSILMENFYKNIISDQPIGISDALSKAKRTLLNTNNTKFVAGPYKELSYSHPYFWAPFIYNGSQ